MTVFFCLSAYMMNFRYGKHGMTPCPCYLHFKISKKGLVRVAVRVRGGGGGGGGGRVALAQDPFRSRARNTCAQTVFVSSATQFLMPRNSCVFFDCILPSCRRETSSNREKTPYFFATTPTFETRSNYDHRIDSATVRSQTQRTQTAATELVRSGTRETVTKNFAK